MKISRKEWFIFIFLSALSILVWYKIEYPQFAFVNLSIQRKDALYRAEAYLESRKVNPKEYIKATVFSVDDWTDRYLQKTIGREKEQKFFKENDHELFSWQIRFFKELKKEEYNIRISSKSGEILGFAHSIEDIEQRPLFEKETAQTKAEQFLNKNYGLNLEDYSFHAELAKRYDQRVDYSFSWEKKNVYIPWKEKEGGAKLLIGATVSGNEIREFYKSRLDIPEKFQRYIENQLVFGEYLSSFSFISLMFLLICAIFIVVKSKQTLAMRFCKKLFLSLAVFLAIINVMHFLNNIQNLIMGYPTTASLKAYLWLYFIHLLINTLFVSAAFILPGLAAESMHSEVFPENKYNSFFYYLKSTFYSRKMTENVIFGYLIFLIMLGLQAIIFYLGQKYLGVWKEWISLTQLSSGYLPFLSAFMLGATAALTEEVMYRMFCITWFKRYLKNTVLAVVLVSLIWGFGHAGYAIFPVWFRCIEVTLLGFLLGFIFIRYGIIPLIVAHYLFDVFWNVVAYIFSPGPTYLFIGSLLTLSLPLLFGLFAFLINKEEKEREIAAIFNPIEKYNLNILIAFISSKKSHGLAADTIREELIRNNWDALLVDLALKEVFKI